MFGEEIEELKVKWICSSCIGEACVETAFAQHYVRTSDHPDGYQWMLLSDPESNYNWGREGELAVYAIMNAADIPSPHACA